MVRKKVVGFMVGVIVVVLICVIRGGCDVVVLV